MWYAAWICGGQFRAASAAGCRSVTPAHARHLKRTSTVFVAFQAAALLGIELLEEHARRMAAALTIDPALAGGTPRTHLKRLRGICALCARSIPISLKTPAPRPAITRRRMAAGQLLRRRGGALDVRHDLPAPFYNRLPRVA